MGGRSILPGTGTTKDFHDGVRNRCHSNFPLSNSPTSWFKYIAQAAGSGSLLSGFGYRGFGKDDESTAGAGLDEAFAAAFAASGLTISWSISTFPLK